MLQFFLEFGQWLLFDWVPHKTEFHMDQFVNANGTMTELKRLHHSGFSKPEFDHLALVLLSPNFGR
jgi:hypothetical protein